MKTLVTGGAGFIGSSIAQALLERGDDVRIIDNISTGFRENLPAGADVLEEDIRDLEAVRRAVRGVEVVFHQAAIRSVPKSVDDPRASNSANVDGTLNVLISAHEAGVRRVVYASSSSAYGDPPGALRHEDMPPDPVSPYGVSKLAAELYCRTWTVLHGLSTVSLRYFNVFGPRQHPESKYSAVFPAFVSALLAGRAPEIHWDGEQSRDFTFISDVVSANLLAAEAASAADGGVFNIGGGRAKTVNDVFRSVSSALGASIEPTYAPKRAGDIRHTLADISRAGELLGWAPKTDWDDSVRVTVDWFRARN
jgi:nucleoside-diphosphate-sugar epimerase